MTKEWLGGKAKIKKLRSRLEILSHLDKIYQVPLAAAGLTHADIIGRVLIGEYDVLMLEYEGDTVGLCIFQTAPASRLCFVYLTYCPNYYKIFENKFNTLMKLDGINEIRAISSHEPSSFSRTTGYKYLFGYFKKEI